MRFSVIVGHSACHDCPLDAWLMRDMSSEPKAAARPPVSQQKAAGIASTLLAKRRTFVLTGAVAFITVAGTLIGATLKSTEQAEEKQVRTAGLRLLEYFPSKAPTYKILQTLRERAEVNKGDQIALLEATRGQLLAQRMQLEKKIGDLRERQRSKAETDSERERQIAGAGRNIER